MLAIGTGMLLSAQADSRAIAAFSTYTLESTAAMCRAAESAGLPVIIQIGSGAYRATSLATLAAAALAAGRACGQPVGLHLDHSRSVEEIRSCIALGFTSVMVDGSHLSFEDNIALTKSIVDEAHSAGVWVEAELGAVAGSEHSSLGARSSVFTDPEEAAEFVRRTGVDVLAAAVGTVHGFTTEEIRVDIARVEEIAQATGVPFALHGSSGVDDAQLIAAIAAGAAKVNVNAELRRAYFSGLRQALADGRDDVLAVQEAVVAAMVDVASDRLKLFGRVTAGTDERARPR